eukprot:TRINITY_DN26495_c0_g1_i1.p1 TRINITY_DN26495_c0_g1~~TRINITY_DN26495_c0_g1_i1.p1  ORF type:complete len:202 (+),score=57.87 TRINITY_DN26495_c0_g1_i1:80-685(+)
MLFLVNICLFFFFKQKTAYEMLRSLVGSEMCIRDRYQRRVRGALQPMGNCVNPDQQAGPDPGPRLWLQVWSGGFVCYFGAMTAAQRDAVIQTHERNTVDPDQNPTHRDLEMSTLMWVSAPGFRDAIAGVQHGSRLPMSQRVSLPEFREGERCSSWFNERWCASWASHPTTCLLYTSDAADEEDSVDLGGRRIIKKKKKIHT